MALSITVAGTDRTAACQFKSMRVSNTLETDGQLMDLEISTTGNWRPEAGNEVVVSTTSDSVRHFAGHIIDLDERLAGAPSQLHYTCICKDYTWLFNRRLVAKNYSAQAASAIVADIVTTYTTGFSTGGIQPSAGVANQRFDYVAPAEAIRGLADQLQWHFYIDYSKTVQFFTAITDIAPTTGIDFDTEIEDYSDLVLHESAANTRNRVVIQGYETRSTLNLTSNFSGDSTTRFFYLGYQPSGISTGDIQISVDGNSVDVLTDTIDGEPGDSVGTSSQAFVCFDNMGIRFSTGGAAPSSSVSVVFTPMRPGGIQWDDVAAQAEMVTRSSGDGIHMFMWNDPTLTNFEATDDLALARAASMTERYGQPRLQGEFTSYLDGWRAGQYFTGTSAIRMGGFTKTLYVYEVTKELVEHLDAGSPVWRHQVRVSESALPL